MLNSPEINHDYFFNFKPIIIKNFFTEEEIKSIYQSREDGITLIPDEAFGFITYTDAFTEQVENKIVNVVQQYAPFKVMRWGNHMPRYTLKSQSQPQLLPHYDTGLDRAALTLSIQLESTLPWQICVGQECFTLERNDAVLFSGSHQIHWRPKIVFSETDYYDILVAQVVQDTENPLTLDQDHRDRMSKEADNLFTLRLEN